MLFGAGELRSLALVQDNPPSSALIFENVSPTRSSHSSMDLAPPRVICPGGAGFETSSASGERGTGLVSKPTRPGFLWAGAMSFGLTESLESGQKSLRQGGFDI